MAWSFGHTLIVILVLLLGVAAGWLLRGARPTGSPTSGDTVEPTAASTQVARPLGTTADSTVVDSDPAGPDAVSASDAGQDIVDGGLLDSGPVAEPDPAAPTGEAAGDPLVPAQRVPDDEPVGVETTDLAPVASEPVATDGEPVEAEPVTAEPVEAEPVEAEPVTAEPVEAEPVAAEAVATEPVAAEVTAEPVAAEVTAEPVATEPVVVEPTAAETNAVEPVGAEPVMTVTAEADEPATPEPVAAEPATSLPADQLASAPAEVTATDATSGDDLRRIEGIGPKMALALNAAGILTYQQLAETDVEALRAAVKAGGARATASLPTWPQQARLLATGGSETAAAFPGPGGDEAGA